MGTLYVFVIIVTLSTHCSAYVVSHSETDRSKASVILKEGQSAEILCMTKGTGDYFWRKGATLYNSTIVASFTVGEVSDDFQPYSVTENGTLHIRSVTLKDEGNYFCRLSSTENECYGEVKILVQASLFNFDLAIDRCDGESSCVLYLDPSQSTSVTCTALNAPPLMTLKWLNGSKEITEVIVRNELLPQNGNSRDITSTVAAVYGHPASLTCQAVDPKRGNDDVRFAHAQVKMKVPAHESLPNWIIVSVTLAGCFFVFGIVLLIKEKVNRKQRKKYKKLNREDVISLKVSADSKDRKISELEEDVKTKDKKISELETSTKFKDKEINDKLQEIIKFQENIKDKDKTISELREKDVENMSAIKNSFVIDKVKATASQAEMEKKENEILVLKREVKNKDKEISTLQTDLKKKDIEIKGKNDDISKLTSAISSSNAIAKVKATASQAEMEKKEKELSVLKSEVKNRDKEISTLRENVKTKDKKISELETSTKFKDKEINDKLQEIVQMKENIKDKDKIISELREKDIENNSAIRNSLEIAKVKATASQAEMEKKENELSMLKREVKNRDRAILALRVEVKTKDKKMSGLEEDVKAKTRQSTD